jgi:hypothetical protein
MLSSSELVPITIKKVQSCARKIISSAELAQASSSIRMNLTLKLRFSELKSNDCTGNRRSNSWFLASRLSFVLAIFTELNRLRAWLNRLREMN